MVWGALLGAGIGAAADLIGGHSAKKAQREANRTNIQLQQENQAWEEKMANTSWQRGSADMKAAGFNPMLAYSQGGANTPNTSAATVSPEDGLARGISSAGSKAAQVITLEGLKLNNALTKEKVKQEAMISNDMAKDRSPVTVEMGGQSYTAQTPQERKRDLETAQAQLAKTNAEVREIERRVAEQTEGANVKSAKARAEILTQEIGINDVRKILMELDIPEKQALAKWFEAVGSGSPAAKAVMSIGQWLKLIFGGK